MRREWLGTVWQAVKIFLFFTCCTLLFYIAMLWVQSKYVEQHRYEKPAGEAIKVAYLSEGTREVWLERLLLFYLDGE
ncbi:DUF4227 family protein [Bacillus thermotolerans]|nr:DUF4227 family protein [Bacillus thermotolerans]